ncbi:WD repeat-containing protein 18 isoform X2 [Hydra vulgaris]|uniref:WD repeat-containing protein 18 isoform X2 n=1 Tax=Hydra vulgaris TaxID=6087 RepID=A0ABM4BHZ9_HYDVU
MEAALITDATGEQSCLSFWNLTTGVILKSFKNGACARNSVDFVGNDYIISGQHEQQLLHIYDSHNEQIVKKIVCPGKISSLAVSPDGHYCIVALVEKIYVWQINTGNLIKILSKHYQNINAIRFSRDGSFFLSCGDDNLLLIWNFSNICQPKDDFNDDSEKPTFILSHHSLPIKDFYVGIGGMRCHVATCSLDQTCKIYDMSSGTLVCSFLFENSCSSVTMDIDEKRLFAGTTNGKIHFVNLYSKEKVRETHVATNESTLQAHIKEVSSLSVSMDGTKLLSGSFDCNVKLWHISSKQCLRTFQFKGAITNAVIVTIPSFLQENHKSLNLKIPIPNFNRTVYTPFMKKPDFDSSEWEDKIPVIIKPLDMSLHKQFVLPVDEINCDKQFNDIVQQCSVIHSPEEFSLETATRDQLIEQINNLQAISKEFYSLLCQSIFKET